MGVGGTQVKERGKEQDWAMPWLSARGGVHAGREQAVAVALAAVSRGVWGGDAPPASRGRLRRRPGPPPRESEGETWPSWGPSLGVSSQGTRGPVLGGQTDPVSSLGSVCLWEQVRQRALGTPLLGSPH